MCQFWCGPFSIPARILPAFYTVLWILRHKPGVCKVYECSRPCSLTWFGNVQLCQHLILNFPGGYSCVFHVLLSHLTGVVFVDACPMCMSMWIWERQRVNSVENWNGCTFSIKMCQLINMFTLLLYISKHFGHASTHMYMHINIE